MKLVHNKIFEQISDVLSHLKINIYRHLNAENAKDVIRLSGLKISTVDSSNFPWLWKIPIT